MTRTPTIRSLALAVLLATTGCATGAANVAQLTVGRGSRPDVLDKVPRILDQHGYQVVDQRDTGNVIQYMSSWITRAPFDDETGRGAAEARTRLTFEARQSAGDTYTMTLKAESTMQRESFDGQWVALAPTPMFREHLRAISEALALEVDMGVRTR